MKEIFAILACISLAIALLGISAFSLHKQKMELLEEIAILKCKIEVLQDSDLKTRINVGYLQSDVKKLQQAAK